LIWLFLAFAVKHFVCDFPLQTAAMLRSKGQYGHPSGILHALIHGAGTLIVAFAFGLPWWIAAADAVIHYHLDWGKNQVTHRLKLSPVDDAFWWFLGADQLAHQMTYLGLVSLVLTAS
jgi:hypothetical protein